MAGVMHNEKAMKAFLWRIVYVAIAVVMLMMILPLFFSVVGFPIEGNLFQLLRLCIACIAVLYVLFGPPPPAPW